MSCEHSRLTFGGDPDTAYHKLLRSQTQYQKLFALNKTPYETYVTYITPELSDLYAEEYARVFSLSAGEKEELLAKTQEDQSKYEEFMVAHYASEKDSQDLTKKRADKIVWKFFLASSENSENWVEATDISKVTLGTQRTYFYPHVNGWNQLYKIRFPKVSEKSRLVMKGPIREVTFQWE